MNGYRVKSEHPLDRLGEAVMSQMADDFRRGYANKLKGVDMTFGHPTRVIIENAELYIRVHFSEELGEQVMQKLKAEAVLLAKSGKRGCRL